MKFNKWTVGLAALGVVSLASAARAEEKMSQVQTALSNTTLSGYVDVAAQWNLGSQNGGPTPLYRYGVGKADGFNLNAIDLAIDKPQDESPWASGYHVELMFGPDGPLSSSYGVTGTDVNGDPVTGNTSPIPSYIRQAYVALRTPVGNGIDWKVGVFDSILGYESNSDPLNPNYTRSYGYSIEPTTLTGVLATYKAGDVLTLQAAVANTWNGVNGRMGIETRKTYAGGITLTAPDSWGALKGGTFNAAVIHAPGAGANGGRTSLYAGSTLPTPIAALKTGFAFNYVIDHDRTVANPSDDNTWVLGLYATIQATDKLSFNARAEYVDDRDGMLYAYQSHYDFATATYTFSPVSQQAEELTLTAQYQLWANVLSRVEFRWDHVEHGQAFDTSKETGNYPVHGNAFLLAFNLIYQF